MWCVTFRENPGGGLLHLMKRHKEFKCEHLSGSARAQRLVRWTPQWGYVSALLPPALANPVVVGRLRHVVGSEQKKLVGTGVILTVLHHLRHLTSDPKIFLSEGRIGSRIECLDDFQVIIYVLFNTVGTSIMRTCNVAGLNWGVLYI